MSSKKTQTFLFALIIILSLSNFVFAVSTIPNNFTFQKNIKAGETLSPDVSYLQYFLNLTPFTRVAETGPGSNTELTNYYGTKTSEAIKKFQNLYAIEILQPAGLLVGNGFFGENTRKKVNSLLKNLVAIVTPIPTPVTKKITTPTTNTGTSTAVNNGNSSSSLLISAVVPNGTNNPNEIINIYGYGFAKNGNTIVSSVGNIPNVNASTNTITFKLSDLSAFKDLNDYLKAGESATILIKVKNKNGLTGETGAVVYQKKSTASSIFEYEQDVVSTTTIDASGEKTTQSGTSVNSLGVLTEAANYDPKLQGSIQAIDLVSSVDPAAATLKNYDPIYSAFGSAGSSALGGLGGGGSSSGGVGGSSGGGYVDNFGGSITNITECTCSASQLLDIKDVRGDTKSLIFQYGYSTLYKEYNLSTGVNVIGGFYQGGVCLVYAGTTCGREGNPDGTIDSIRGIGTSMN